MPDGILHLIAPMVTRRIKGIYGQALSAKDPEKENNNEEARPAVGKMNA
jgi:hypothetical protein